MQSFIQKSAHQTKSAEAITLCRRPSGQGQRIPSMSYLQRSTMEALKTISPAREMSKHTAPGPIIGFGHRTTFEGDHWERDASRRAETALARQSTVAGVTSAPREGGPLHPAERSAMEAGFGHDFSRVRIFANDRSNIATQLAARAVTIDHDIYFARGEYQAGGRELLAHELAHVVQRDMGAPILAYRDGRDVRRVANVLRHASNTLHQSVRFLPTPEVQALVRSIAMVIDGFFPVGHGLIDQHGRITTPSSMSYVDQPIRRGSITGTYRHEVRFYLSEEPAREQGRYQPTTNGGEIRIFVPNIPASMPDPDLFSTVSHELVHLFTDIIGRATQFAHRLRATQPPLPGGGRPVGGRPDALSISLADPSLGGNLTFATQVDALRQVYGPVVDLVNQARIVRGQQPLDGLAVAASWAARTGDELLAYVIDEQVNIAVQFATQPRGRSRGLVAIGPPNLDPRRFFRVYAHHWLADPADRAALQTPEAEPILDAAGRSAAMRAVYGSIRQWVQLTRSP